MILEKVGELLIYLIKFVYSFILPPGIFVLLLLGMVVWLWKNNRRPAIVLLAVTLLLYLSMTSAVSDTLIGSLGGSTLSLLPQRGM